MESGVSMPSLPTLFRMARALHTNLSDLFKNC
ncbi:MAG: hypothetical protein ACYTF1_03000 [Planctomycetota bacterium]